ncbi:DMT family transporter [Neisseria sp. Ec49-e6-T10]|uniref:DMT family transporter n=1 Tax=Neisseria sp. Ec49-e6-T10 TaxID=3140744 RepID=UPI003EC0E6A6
MPNNTTPHHNLLGIIQIMFAAALWGAFGIAGAILSKHGFSGIEVTSIRLIGASIILLLFLPFFASTFKILLTEPKRLLFLALQSILGMLIMTLCFLSAISLIGPSIAVALLYTAPIWSLILSRLILGEGITQTKAWLAVAAAIGVMLMLSGSGRINVLGFILGLCSGISYALYGVLGKRAMQGNPPSLVFFTSVFISGLIMLFFPATINTLHKLNTHFNLITIGASLYVIFLGTLLPYFLFIKGLQKMPAATASVFTTIEPVVGIILAALIMKDYLHWNQYLGIVLILSTALINALMMKKTNSKLT